jgi:hypothetical protein
MGQDPEFNLWKACNWYETCLFPNGTGEERDPMRRNDTERKEIVGRIQPDTPQSASRSPVARVMGRAMAFRIDSSGPTTMSRSSARVTAV